MNKLSESLVTSWSLSLAAGEEASRWERKEIDVDHLFLALLLSEQPAGQVLRSFGISVHDARQAVEDQHDSQIRYLGVSTPPAEPGRITFHETMDGLDWTQRATNVTKQVNNSKGAYNAAGVLRALLDEPSGFIRGVLERLEVPQPQLLARLERAEAHAVRAETASKKPTPGELTASRRIFIPAAAEDIWSLVADPQRLPEWDPIIDRIEVDPSSPGEVWLGHASERRSNGKPTTYKPQVRRRQYRRERLEAPRFLTWSISFPDYQEGKPQRWDLELCPTEGGTDLTVSVTFQRTPRRGIKRLGSSVIWPVVRKPVEGLFWIQATTLANQIGLHFR